MTGRSGGRGCFSSLELCRLQTGWTTDIPLMLERLGLQLLSNISHPSAHLTDEETETQGGKVIRNWYSGPRASGSQRIVTREFPWAFGRALKLSDREGPVGWGLG